MIIVWLWLTYRSMNVHDLLIGWGLRLAHLAPGECTIRSQLVTFAHQSVSQHLGIGFHLSRSQDLSLEKHGETLIETKRSKSDGFDLDWYGFLWLSWIFLVGFNRKLTANCSSPFWSDLLGVLLVTVHENFEDGLTMVKHQEETWKPWYSPSK